MKKHLQFLYLSALILLTGCLVSCGGGGGSSSAASTPAVPANLSGKVIDGYIIGATVCLDLNSNNKCDAGEPTTTSDAEGGWILPPYMGSIAGLQVVAEVGATARDKDTGVIGSGNTYSLLAPAAASATVTPFSTMVVSTIAAGGGESRVSIGEALTNVSAKTGIPVAKLVANDYKANDDTKLGAVAQTAVAAMAQVSNNLRSNADIRANLTEGQIIQQAIIQVQEKVLPQLISDGQVSIPAATSTLAIKEVVTAAVSNASLSANTLSGKVQNIIAATQSGDGVVLSMADLFKAGFVTPQFQTGDYINSKGERYDGPQWSISNPNNFYWKGYSGLNVGYLQFDAGVDTTPPSIEFVLANNNKWYLPYRDGESWTFDGTNWVQATDIGSNSKNAKPIFDQNCVIVSKNDTGNVSQRYCATEKKLGGQLMTKYIPSMCDPKTGAAIASGCNAATFPEGSSAYDLTATTIANLTGKYNGLFDLWVNTDGTWNGFCTVDGGTCQSSDSTVLDFINWTLKPNRWQSIGDACNTTMKVQSYNPTARTGVIDWGSNSTGCSGNNSYQFSKVESSNFEVITLGGKDVLIVPSPAVYRANNPSNQAPYQIFARHPIANKKDVKGNLLNGIWHGSYFPTNFKESIPFTGDPATNTQIINPVMFDAILKQKGLAPYPYKGKSSSGTWNGSYIPSTNPN